MIFLVMARTLTVVHVHVCKAFCLGFPYLVVQVPGLIVFLCAFPAIDGLVVYLDELPFRTVAEVSKKAAEASDKQEKHTIAVNPKQVYDMQEFHCTLKVTSGLLQLVSNLCSLGPHFYW